MKTPKRKLTCPNCGEEIIVEIPSGILNRRLVFRCPSGCTLHDSRYILHGEIPELYKFTRWKRKNREARLRNLIHWQAEDIKWFKGTLKERTEARDWLVVCYRELACKRDLEGGVFNASGTFGHDVEGS